MTENEFCAITQELGLNPKIDVWGLYAYNGPNEDDWVAHYDYKENKGIIWFGGIRERSYKSPHIFKEKLIFRIKELKEEQLRYKLNEINKDFY